MKNKTIALWLISIIVFYGFAMEEQLAINNPDCSLTPEQQKEKIKKYAATTWKQDFRYGDAVFIAQSYPWYDMRKEIIDQEWKEKYSCMVENGLDISTIKAVKEEYFKHKVKITKRVCYCYGCFAVTPVLIYTLGRLICEYY